MKSIAAFLLLFTVFVTAQTKPLKYQLLVFEGSDWCVNCIKLKKNTLKDTLFIKYLYQKKITIAHVDFPQRKKQDKKTVNHNKSLAEQYGFKGVFPTLILTNTQNGKFARIINKKTDKIIEDIEQKIIDL